MKPGSPASASAGSAGSVTEAGMDTSVVPPTRRAASTP